MSLSVCALFYGDYPDIASRLLDSLVSFSPPSDVITDVRIGLNAVGRATRDFVFAFCGCRMLTVPCYVYEPDTNVGKYPLMRRMFYDYKRPLAKQVMWFDDDSFLDRCDERWWRSVTTELGKPGVGIVGARHTIRPRGRQIEGIRRQPWYAGVPLKTSFGRPGVVLFEFATGAWWLSRSDFICRWNYPFPEIWHNGGDSILGELIRQQGLVIANEKKFYNCRCEACLKHASPNLPGRVHINVGGRKGRRGIGVALKDEVYPWQNYDPLKHAKLTHHDFRCQIHVFSNSAA